MKLEGEPDLCGKLSKLESVTSEGVMTDACAAAVDALKILSRHQCVRDLVEEFVCAKVLPLRAVYKKVAEATEELIGAL